MKAELNELTKRFINVWCSGKEDYIDWYNDTDEASDKETIYITDPSHHIAIIDTKKCIDLWGDATPWTTYINKGLQRISNQETMIHWEGHFFSGAYIDDIVNKFFKDNVQLDIRTISHKDMIMALVFKINNRLSLAVPDRRDTVRIENGMAYYDKLDLDDNVEETLETEWDGKKAVWIDKWYGKEFKRTVIDKNVIFEEYLDEGDSLLI